MRRTFAACVLLAAAAPAPAADYPHVYLKNEKLKVKVYLPDAEKGFYRGTRFDWAGVLGEVEFAGHKIFGPWKDTHDPTNHDDIIGPCEEFGNQSPLGYTEAKPGGTFLKIGVGELEKPDDKPYSFARKYKIVKPAGWKETDVPAWGLPEDKTDGPRRSWIMTATGPGGYGYEYAKDVALSSGLPIFVIRHRLKNTGTKPITTDVYNHNFFNVNAAPIGPDYVIDFGFLPKPVDPRGRFAELVTTSNTELRLRKELTNGYVMAGLTGFDPRELYPRVFRLCHRPSRMQVQVMHTAPVSKMNVWGVKTTICPEPYHLFKNLQPGGTEVWSVIYLFQQDPPKK